jgi:adenosine deaminase
MASTVLARPFGWLGLAVALLAAPALAAPPDLADLSPPALAALTRAFPKGGELHLHLSGAVYGESYLKWTAEDGRCIDTEALSIEAPPCSGARKPAAEALADLETYHALLDSFSVRHPGFRARSGHDQFFTTFDRFSSSRARRGDALAEVMERTAAQNSFYLELMALGGPPALAPLASAASGGADDLPALKASLTAAGLERLTGDVVAETDAMEARARSLMACGTPAARPGCQVTVRYLFAATRNTPPKITFAQIQLGVAMVRADRRWVGVQILTPEDDPVAVANYALVARMFDFLTQHGRAAPEALHAGELTLALAPPEALRDHVAQAVRVSGARRIGHGTDIAGEDGAEALAREMAAAKVLVEVNLSSNAAILEVKGADHPYGWLRARGVPVSLSTDDPGVSRTDLSAEYALAVRYGADYAALKTSARNALAFSFLAGEGLWADPDVYRTPAAACRGQIGRPAPTGACADLDARSDKAREQWRHEALLARFEAAFP